VTAAPVITQGEHASFSRAVKSLRWIEQGVAFELRSSNRRVLEMARGVFPSATNSLSAEPSMSWTIDDDELTTDEQISFRLVNVEAGVLQYLIDNPADKLTVHSALLARDGKGVVIVGPSFAGKSTLATGLWRAGWTLLADDLCFLNPDAISASPAPRRVSLRFGSRPIVGEELWAEIQRTPSFLNTAKGLYFHPHEVSHQSRTASVAISAILFLARLDVVIGPAELVRIHDAKAALALLPYAFNARSLPFIEGLSRVTPICERVPIFDLGRGNLPDMIAAVEHAVA
jgi:hypothetical protein